MSDHMEKPFDDAVAALIAMAGDTGLETFEQVDDQLEKLDVDDADMPQVIERLFDALKAHGVGLNDSSEPPAFPPDYAGLRVIKGGRG